MSSAKLKCPNCKRLLHVSELGTYYACLHCHFTVGQLAGELNPTPGQVLARTPIMWKKGKFTYYVNGVKKNKADSIILMGKVIEPLGKGKTITG